MVRRDEPVCPGVLRSCLLLPAIRFALALGSGSRWVLRRRLCVRPDDVLQFLATSDEFLDDWLLWRASSDSVKVSSIGIGSTSRRFVKKKVDRVR